MQKPLRRNQKGFTILEVVFAAAVMALAISSSILVMGRGLASLDTARCLSYASQIMQSEMEKIRLTQWGDGTSAGGGTFGVTAFSTTATALTIDSTFVSAGDVGSRMTLTRKAEDVHPGMIKITLVITWTTYDRRTLTRSYVTYYGKNGLYDYFIA
jgi:Tfp pilus assembly protein PilV